MKTAAILVAAGSSARMKSGGASKTMMEIGGEPVLSRTLRAFENAACISKIVIVARACDFDAIQKASAFVTKPLTITEGGKERQDSVSNGAALCGDAEYIAVHDAARPFITPEEIETVARMIENHDFTRQTDDPMSEILKDADMLSHYLNASALGREEEFNPRAALALEEMHALNKKGEK